MCVIALNKYNLYIHKTIVTNNNRNPNTSCFIPADTPSPLELALLVPIVDILLVLVPVLELSVPVVELLVPVVVVVLEVLVPMVVLVSDVVEEEKSQGSFLHR